MVEVEGIDPFDVAYFHERFELNSPLIAATANSGHLRVIAGKVFSRHGRRRPGSENSDFNRVHEGQRVAVLPVTEHDDPLNIGHSVTLRVPKEVSIHLRSKVCPGEFQPRSFDMKPSVVRVDAQYTRRQRLAFRI